MGQVRCEQCGRALAPGHDGTGTCPSCGRAATLPTQALTSMLSARDEAATRPVPPGAGTLLAASAPARPVDPDLSERATAPPPPPHDALTAPAAPYPAYETPSLPRSAAAVAGGGAGAERDSELPAHGTGSEEAAHAERGDAGVTGALAATPRLDPTATLPPGLVAAQRERDRQARGKGERGWRGRLGIVSAVGLVVVLLLGVAGVVLAANGQLFAALGGSPTIAATPTSTRASGPPAPPSGFHTYQASDGSFRLWVPDTWSDHYQLVGNVNFTLFADPSAKANFEIEAIAGLDDPQNLDDQFIAGLGPVLAGKGGTASAGAKSAPDEVPAAGILWTREFADVVVTSAGQTTTWHVVTLAAQHGAQTLLIAYFAPGGSFAALSSADFQPMLDSLLFVMSQP